MIFVPEVEGSALGEAGNQAGEMGIGHCPKAIQSLSPCMVDGLWVPALVLPVSVAALPLLL